MRISLGVKEREMLKDMGMSSADFASECGVLLRDLWEEQQQHNCEHEWAVLTDKSKSIDPVYLCKKCGKLRADV